MLIYASVNPQLSADTYYRPFPHRLSADILWAFTSINGKFTERLRTCHGRPYIFQARNEHPYAFVEPR